MNREEIKELISYMWKDELSKSGKRKIEEYIKDLQRDNKKMKQYFEEVKKRCNLMALTTTGDNYDYAQETFHICREILRGNNNDR